MSRRVRSALPYRVRSILSGWWIDVRFRWCATRKIPFVLAFLAIGLAASLGAGFNRLSSSIAASKEYTANLNCLALNVYHEARGEPLAGQYAVAEVTMNRVASGRFPNTVCGAVYQKEWDYLRRRYVGAFSWTEFDQLPQPRGVQWARAWKVAETVYTGRHPPQLKGALYYHALYARPRWAGEKKRVAAIGRHVFYR
jgi:spore germination cell wall hydrolase CwlJ-like protein